jgi:hypothetical protein
VPAGRILPDRLAILFVYLCTHKEAGQARPEVWMGVGQPSLPMIHLGKRARGVPRPETQAAPVSDHKRSWFFSIDDERSMRKELHCGR